MAQSNLSIGLTGLLVAQRALQTAGHNVANANTPGYSRQIVSVSARDPQITPFGLVGQGVTIDQIRRIKDELMESQIRNQTSLLGSSGIQSNSLQNLQVFFNELSSSSLSSTLDKFFQSVQDLSTNPELISSRNQLLQDSINLVNTINLLDEQFKQLQFDASKQIITKVADLNSITSEIAMLNGRITSLEITNGNANDLRDKRDALLIRLSKLADIQITENGIGSINVLLGGTLVVNDNRSEELFTTTVGQGTVRINGIATVNGGELKGLLDIQNITIPKYMQRLNTLAASIIKEVNNIHSEGLGLGGGFTSLTSTIAVNNPDDPLSNTGLPFSPSVNTYTTGTITSADNGNGTSTVTGTGTTFTGNVKANHFIKIGGNFYKILSVDSNTQLTVSGAVNSAFILTDITDGNLYVTVKNDTTGEIIKTNISIASDETLNTLTAKISGITNLNASVSNGFLTINSDPGFTFGFTKALDTNPGSIGASVVSLSGNYNGNDNDNFTLTVLDAGTGSIGTGSAVIRVTDVSGTVLADLDVGASYTPGDVLQIADGVSISFGAGNISAGPPADVLTFDVVNDPDTSNMLTALGMNTFFGGKDASTIEVTQYIKDDVSRIAAASTGSVGDNTNALRLAGLQNSLTTNNATFSDFLSGTVAELGIETRQKSSEKESFESLLLSLENRRQEISGVSIDEEMINIIRFQQAFQASARFISTISELNDVLMSLK
ncbi:MAG: flagellar hook-associated protein FlgK [Candidatus Scalinduaceae bacterium]